MTRYKYRNKAETELVIFGVGTVEPGAEFESELVIENPNVELIEQIKKRKSAKKEEA